MDLLHQETLWRDDDLVFAHPHTGKPSDRSKLLKRLKAALAAGGSGSTICLARSALGWPRRASRCGRCQEMLGHRDFKTMLIYADYTTNAHEAEWVEAAFALPPVIEAEA